MPEPKDVAAPETARGRCPLCDTLRVRPTGAVIVGAGAIRKVHYRCEGCGQRFWILLPQPP
jgi:hypothetical protein